MKSRSNLWLVHSLGKAYGQRPSAFLGVWDSWTAYQVDMAALTVGCEVEAALAKGKSVASALGERGRPKGKAKETFRDPTPFVSARMPIPESGVW